MRQFYDTYAGHEKVSALLRQLPWTHNLIILGQAKRPEEREFYLKMAIVERWSSREQERQFKTALFEPSVLSPHRRISGGGSAVLSRRLLRKATVG